MCMRWVATLCEALTCIRPAGPGGSGHVELPAELPAAFRDVVARCLSQDPRDRPTLAALNAWLRGEPLVVNPPAPAPVPAPEPAPAPVRAPTPAAQPIDSVELPPRAEPEVVTRPRRTRSTRAAVAVRRSRPCGTARHGLSMVLAEHASRRVDAACRRDACASNYCSPCACRAAARSLRPSSHRPRSLRAGWHRKQRSDASRVAKLARYGSRHSPCDDTRERRQGRYRGRGYHRRSGP